MKAVMYHYVRPGSDQLPHFRFLHIDDFCQQIDFFRSNFSFPTRDEFVHGLAHATLPDNSMVLTFDDGLKDHFEYVLPALAERNLWGVFYVPTGMYETGQLLDVHRIHLLLGRYGGKAILESLRALVVPDMLEKDHVHEFREVTYSTQANDEHTLQVKRCLNYFIKHDCRASVMSALMKQFFDDESQLVSEYYMTVVELRQMHEAGMLLGAHTINHPVMSRLSDADQDNEIRGSFRFLDQVVGSIVPRSFCYPYGGVHSYSSKTEQLLNRNRCQFSFDVDPRDITDEDIRHRRQALPRYDCNMFPFGTCRQIPSHTEVSASRAA
jgi:peptidoglycan/xylan/chitin deacetylase (PgdA/CDA1 family)